LKPDGSDVRVVARGKEVPRRVLCVGPGDRVTVAFQLVGATDSYQVYYGNPKADTPDDDWEIRAGLLLEVRQYRGGTFNNLRQAEDTWRRSTVVSGVDFVGQIFSGSNPFGPGGSFMARYTGWLRVDEDGRYEFATTSSNGSFLLIDGAEVVSWPGWHGAAPRARRTGTVALKAGRHRLEYLHIHAGGVPTAVAAWQPPGARRPVVIPARAFLPVARAVVQPEQRRDENVTPEFDTTAREAPLDLDRDLFVYRYAFRDLTPGIDRRYYRPLWDFGDGVTATVWLPEHVYLVAGTYTVSLQLNGALGTFTTKQRIVVERDWSRQTSESHVDALRDYLETVRGYDFGKMPASSVSAACWMFERLRAYDDAVRAGRVLVFETPGVPGGVLHDEAMRLATLELEKLRKPADAVAALTEAERKITGAPDAKTMLAVRAARITLDELDDADAALACARRALETARTAKPETRRHALLALAEVAIRRGEADEARRRLAEADAIPIRRGDRGGRAVRVGSLSRAVEDYVRRGEFAEASTLLDTWEWEYPLDRIAGCATLLRAKLHITRQEYPRAVRLLTTLVKVNPRSNYAPEALMIAADCHTRLGDKPAARDTYNRVITGYPESPFVKDAVKALERLN
ncbi:MAG TPA: tetratricopeptide repeat protein, partial [Planctomycetota bacterium]|nr:tetratricopeptide repeat protein [Planctomycetota bacterium]